MVNLLTSLAWRKLFKRAKAEQKVLWVTMDTTEEASQFFMLPVHVGWMLVTFAVMDQFDENEVTAVSTAPIWSFSYVNHAGSGRVRQKLENLYNDNKDPGAAAEDTDDFENDVDSEEFDGDEDSDYEPLR